MDKPCGKITHYYDKIGVAVIDLSQSLAVGDKIKITGNDKEFTQEVLSMQMEHDSITKAQKGKTIGLKVDQPVNKHALVYKV